MNLSLADIWDSPASGSPRSRRGTTRNPNANSAEALRSIEPHLTPARISVLSALAARPSTDNELMARWIAQGLNPNTPRPRRVELEAMGYVEYCGDRDGSAVWRVSEAGLAAIREGGK